MITAHATGSSSTFRLLTNQPDDHAHLPPRRHTRPTHTQNTHAPPPPKPHTTPNQTPNHTTKPNPTTKPTSTKTKNISTRVRISREEGGEKGERKSEEKGKGKKKRRGKKRKISAHGFEPRTAFITQSGPLGSVTIERAKVATCPAQRDACASPRTADVLIMRLSDAATQVVYLVRKARRPRGPQTSN